VRIPIESIPHATAELLKFGADLEVIEPVELRAALRRAAQEMSALYGSTPIDSDCAGGPAPPLELTDRRG
jgi:hypothetical protein